MDGLIVVDKPLGITSAKALDEVRRITRQRKSGHAGTLDPLATGVLVICLGKATRLVERIMELPKSYRAQARLDLTSDSFDLGHPSAAVAVHSPPDRQAVEAAFDSFIGEVDQIPPAISALKVGGLPAYEHARRGRALDLPPRRVRIDALEVLRYDWPHIEFEMTCGRGTYVRALIRDVGERLSTGGCLTALVRTAVGPLRIEHAWTLEALRQAESPAGAVIPISEVLARFEGAPGA